MRYKTLRCVTISACAVLMAALTALTTLHSAQNVPAKTTSVRITYSLVENREDLPAVHQRYNAQQLALLEKLNRADLEHLARLKAHIAPDVWDLDELAYSPLPIEYESAKASRKAIVVDLPRQVFGGYEQGRLVRWGPVSSGSAKSLTPSGQFHLNWRSKGRPSTVDERWFLPWYFNFINKRGISFHEFALPGYPASHSCLRLLQRDAMWLYSWGEEWKLDSKGWAAVEQGTPVLILGQYRFDQPPPWLFPDSWTSKITLEKPGDGAAASRAGR